ncbi:MAG TPA: transposase [Candidatus Dormibacteraeota bacterium]|nr:transposase [Candidatus Dormibacteraeota bacterium]
MLTRQAGQVETVWDELFPEFVRTLPDDLARLDQVLDAPAVLKKFEQHWGRANLNVGRPSIPMATYLRLMALKHRNGLGYERLVGQVADSFHLRRFCRISIVADVPDESTIRKLTRRLGPDLVDELAREVVRLAIRERGFRARAMRCDSTVQESDIRHPTDSDLAADVVKVLARSARKVHAAIPGLTRKVRDRSRAAGKRTRELGRTLARRTGDAREQVQRLTEEIAELAKASLGQARRLLAEAQLAAARAGRRSRRPMGRAVVELEEMIVLGAKVVEQIRRRFAGEKIANRLVSLYDPDARPIRKGKMPNPNQFGYTTQYTELTANTRRGARGLLVPPKMAIGNPHEDTLLPESVAEIIALDLKLVEAVFDRGFTTKATVATMAGLGARVFIAGSPENDGSRRTRRRLASHRVGCEGRIAHLKREYGAGRSRLKGATGARIWAGWTALAYNLDTVARLPIRKTTTLT